MRRYGMLDGEYSGSGLVGGGLVGGGLASALKAELYQVSPAYANKVQVASQNMTQRKATGLKKDGSAAKPIPAKGSAEAKARGEKAAATRRANAQIAAQRAVVLATSKGLLQPGARGGLSPLNLAAINIIYKKEKAAVA